MAFSSLQFELNTSEKKKDLYKKDLKFYTNLRNAIVNTYSDQVDFRKYEKQLQKLLDQHVTTEEVIRLTELVSILDTDAFEKELEKVVGGRAKAETIASRTSKHITDRMDEDPVFYKKLSELIQQTISDLRAMRISDIEALRRLKEYREQAVSKKSDDIPNELLSQEIAIPFYRILKEDSELDNDKLISFALQTDIIIKQHQVVDWPNKLDVIRKMNFYIGEYLIDEMNIPIEKADEIAEKCVGVAIKNYK
jgi:type I restriction enzyme R subunit